jgi:nuclease A inhibitor-like protein
VRHARAGRAELTPERFFLLMGKSPDTSIETRDFEEFFQRFTAPQGWWDEQQPAQDPRYLRLESLPKRNLTELHVFRTDTIEVGVYIVRKKRSGDLVRLNTTSVET